MIPPTSFLAAVAALAATVRHVQAHGFMKDPLTEFKRKTQYPSEWIVEIPPPWKGDWDGAVGEEGLVALYRELKASKNVEDIRTLLDGDTTLYGSECGKSDPKVKPKKPPKTGDATFSSSLGHPGPCEIWLDDEMVLQSDDCMSEHGSGIQGKMSVLKPVDYSRCAHTGCMFRFFWLAFQRPSVKTVWQVYKNCIPLSGPSDGGASYSPAPTGNSSSPPTPAETYPASKSPSVSTPSASNTKCSASKSRN